LPSTKKDVDFNLNKFEWYTEIPKTIQAFYMIFEYLDLIDTTFLFCNPEVRTDGNVFHARTSFWVRVIFLFCFDKNVEVDRTHQIIRITSRVFWFFNLNRSIPFDRITDLETYSSAAKNNMGMELFTYSIVLLLKNPRERYTLINFKDGFTTAKNAFREYLDLLRKFVRR